MKKYLVFASAILALASCTSDAYIGDQDPSVVTGEKSISFGFNVPATTRAEGAAAAQALSNQFIVWGEKSEAATGAAYSAAADDAHQLVFKNYLVQYTPSSANTTTSNTENWEYVGLTQSYGSNVTPAAGETQTIKYWDYSASNYVFTAFSAPASDLTSGYVKVTKIQEKTTGNMVYDKGYTVTLTADADPNTLYFSDRQVISQSSDYDRYADNQYGGNVTLTFRNGMSQVRVAMYETIPGYTAEIKQFYYTDGTETTGDDKFYATTSNLPTANQAATLNVTYYESGTRLNQPKIDVDGTPNEFITLGANLQAGTVLGVDKAHATYDQSTKAYTTFFPQDNNVPATATNMKLKVDYILRNATTGEFITVTGATAEVPKEYMMWKPNFKYTYFFKISDNTNGSTGTPGTDPAGLYPITFDAAVVVAENGQAEYITTVSEPSITTFGVNSSGKYVTDGSEYAANSDIYAAFMEGSTVQTPTLGSNVNIYTVTGSAITEAAVAEAIANPARITNPVYTYDSGTDSYAQVTDAATLATGTTYYKADANSVAPGATGYIQTVAVAGTDYQVAPAITCTLSNGLGTVKSGSGTGNGIPGEDGIEILGVPAVKLTALPAGTYAVEYTASAAWTGSYTKVYKVIVVQ